MSKMEFLYPQEAEKFKNKSGNSFGGHPVFNFYVVSQSREVARVLKTTPPPPGSYSVKAYNFLEGLQFYVSQRTWQNDIFWDRTPLHILYFINPSLQQ